MTQKPLHQARNPRLEQLGRSLLRRFSQVSPATASWIGFQLFATPLRDYYPIPTERTAILNQAQTAVIHTRIAGRQQRIQVYLWGPEDGQYPVASDAPTVLLVHGWMCTAALMSGFVGPLREAGFRVVAIDGPAHGRSSGWQTNLRQFGEAIQAVGRQFGALAGVVAHSFGGAAAVLLQHECGGQPGTEWGRLVLASVPAETKFMMHVIAQAINASCEVEADMQRRFLERYGEPIERFSIAQLAQGLEMPGLLLHDRDDGLIPFEQGEAIAQIWTEAEFVITEGLGHSQILHSPKVLQTVKEFLTR